MRILVVYHSLEGNTRLAAKTIADSVEADILELVPVSQPSSQGFSRYLWGGRSAVMKDKPELEKFQTDPADYDLVVLGSPVWAWTFTPPVRSFLHLYDLSGKKTALFCCHGGGPGKAMKRFRNAVAGSIVLGELLLQDPLKQNTDAQLEKARVWAAEIAGKAQIRS